MAGASHSLAPAGASPASAFRLARVVPLYVAAIGAAEAVTAFLDVTAGATCHALLLLALLTHYVVVGQGSPEDRAPGAYDPACALPALALVPLLRILSLTTPVEDVSRLWWYAMAGAPLLLGAVLTQRLLGVGVAALGLPPHDRIAQLVIALSGLPLGLVAYALVEPEQIVANPGVSELLLGSLALMAFSGLAEELVFRGLIQRTLAATLGPVAGLLLSSGLFAAVYLGSQSAAYVGLMAATGVAFGLCMQRTGSIAGIALAHGLLSAGAVLVWPAVLG